jgi:hypothetical protein
MKEPLKEEDFTAEELQKCEDSPPYFYNKYVRKPGEPEISEADWDTFRAKIEAIRQRGPFKYRGSYPLTPDEVFKKEDK